MPFPDHGAEHIVVVQGDVGERLVSGDDGVPDEEIDEAHHFGDDENDDHEDDHLGHEHTESPRRGQQRLGDQSARVLVGDYEHPQDLEGEQAEAPSRLDDREGVAPGVVAGWPGLETTANVMSADKPITTKAVTARVMGVDRSVRILVHSERTVSENPGGRDGPEGTSATGRGAATVWVTGLLLPAGHGTRRRRGSAP